jgi:hypothetical protein
VHKDNKDISTNPTMLPPGPPRSAVRAKAKKQFEKEKETGKLSSKRPVPISEGNQSSLTDDVEQEAKKARVDGMRSIIDKNKVEAINAQITVMRQLEDVYVSRMGRERYELQLVNLVNQMPGMLVNDQIVNPHTPTSDAYDIDEENIDDTFDFKESN